MTRKILYVSGTRADYGLMRSVLAEIARRPGLELHVVATGMHLMPEFGSTVDEIRCDGFLCHVVEATYERDTKESMALFIGTFLRGLVPLVTELSPDIILLLGDRGEMLAGAIAGAYLGIPVAHIHGGEVTATADESARHAITKLAHIHLPATAGSARRIIAMGENPENIIVTGAPGLDAVRHVQPAAAREVAVRYGIDPAQPFLLVVQHPVPLEPGDPAARMEATLAAACSFPHPVLVSYPNADAGGRAMINVIRNYADAGKVKAFASLGHADFLALLSLASAIVGNSSSGIIEAPSFGVPAVNIGTRQAGRERGENVIECGYGREEIAAAIRLALTDAAFRRKVKSAENPYGTGESSAKIAGILETFPLAPELLQKRMMY
jgi:UDP-hydrolysing UDP-N-acetyl-D-glucosamine 2-epimerase